MDLNNKYSVYIGSARGTITHTNLNPEKKIQYEFAEEASEISSMVWGKQDDILVGYKNGIVNFYDTISQKYGKSLKEFKNDGAVVGLGCLDDKILVTSSKGKISVMDAKNTINSFITLSSEDATLVASSQNMNKMNIVATGGESNDLKLWDVETKQSVFKAKSMGHDYLNLPIKTSIRGISFIPEEQNLCCCATKEGHVLLYDDRAQRRPVCKYFEPKASFTSMTTAYRGRNILAGTNKGYIQYIDMKNGKCLKTFTGTCGSVTCLLCDPAEPLVFSTSLDRFVRIYNLDTKEMLFKEYLKQNLKKVLIKPILKEENDDVKNEEEVVDEEFEEIFRNMKEITEEPSKKRKKTVTQEKSKKLKLKK